MTIYPALANSSSIGPATEESNAENTTRDVSVGVQASNFNSLIVEGIFDDIFQLTKSQLDDVGRALSSGLGESIDDIARLDPASIVAKRGLAKRVGSLFKNGKFWGALQEELYVE